jgi:hypothetical protein
MPTIMIVKFNVFSTAMNPILTLTMLLTIPSLSQFPNLILPLLPPPLPKLSYNVSSQFPKHSLTNYSKNALMI